MQDSGLSGQPAVIPKAELCTHLPDQLKQTRHCCGASKELLSGRKKLTEQIAASVWRKWINRKRHFLQEKSLQTSSRFLVFQADVFCVICYPMIFCTRELNTGSSECRADTLPLSQASFSGKNKLAKGNREVVKGGRSAGKPREKYLVQPLKKSSTTWCPNDQWEDGYILHKQIRMKTAGMPIALQVPL